MERRAPLGLTTRTIGPVDRKLRTFLRRRGASSTEIEQAAAEGWLKLLAFDRAVMPGRPRLTFPEISQKAGIPLDVAQRIWRALGFPDPPFGQRSFTERDVEALVRTMQLMEDTMLAGDEAGIDELVQQVRIIAGALARIAEVQGDNLVRAVHAAEEAGLSDEQIALTMRRIDLDRGERLLTYALRLQLRATAWRRLAGEGGRELDGVNYAVGFVDLVGYTALSQELDDRDLALLVARFEGLAYDTVAQYGGRVVKTIGDEVMFVSSDVGAAARIILRLTERSNVDELLPDARAGLARGEVLAREGDYYGTVVNLARRIVELARPGTAVCSDRVHDALADDPSFTWRRLRTRRIRDIGSVGLWQLRSVADTVETPIVDADQR